VSMIAGDDDRLGQLVLGLVVVGGSLLLRL
jgi:hypothetical protein